MSVVVAIVLALCIVTLLALAQADNDVVHPGRPVHSVHSGGNAGALSPYLRLQKWIASNAHISKNLQVIVGTAPNNTNKYPHIPLDGRRSFGVFAASKRPPRKGEAYARVPWSLTVCASERHSAEARAPNSTMAAILRNLRGAIAKSHSERNGGKHSAAAVNWTPYEVAFGSLQMLALRYGEWWEHTTETVPGWTELGEYVALTAISDEDTSANTTDLLVPGMDVPLLWDTSPFDALTSAGVGQRLRQESLRHQVTALRLRKLLLHHGALPHEGVHGSVSAWLWAYATWRSRTVYVPKVGSCFVPILGDFVNDALAEDSSRGGGGGAPSAGGDGDPEEESFVEMDAMAQMAVSYARRTYSAREEIDGRTAAAATTEDALFHGGYLPSERDGDCAPVRMSASSDREKSALRARGMPTERTWCLPGRAHVARRTLREVTSFASALASASHAAPPPTDDGLSVPGVHAPCSSTRSAACLEHGGKARDILFAALLTGGGGKNATELTTLEEQRKDALNAWWASQLQVGQSINRRAERTMRRALLVIRYERRCEEVRTLLAAAVDKVRVIGDLTADAVTGAWSSNMIQKQDAQDGNPAATTSSDNEQHSATTVETVPSSDRDEL